jgi:hypothetical protein
VENRPAKGHDRTFGSRLRGLTLTLCLTLTLTLGAAGCSSSKDVDFTGTWAFSSGALTGSCLGMTINNDLTAQTFTLAKGTTSDLLFTLGTCQVKLDVNGNTAAASAGQSCMFTVPPIGPVTVAITSWTMTSTDSGHTLTTSAAGTAVGGTCPVMLSGAAVKATASSGDASTGS